MTKVKEPVSATANRELTITRLISAPRQLIWEVWTSPDHIKNWWGPNGFHTTIHKMEVRPGGVWNFIMHGPDGKDYENKDVFVDIVKPEKIVYDHINYPKHRATITFEEQGNNTLLRMTMVFETIEVKDQSIKTNQADEGLKQTISRLETYLKNTPAAQ
jgi:uncharacterized protein YndB with AHSA1/START domain